MAKVVDQVIAIKISKIVKDSQTDTSVITDEQINLLSQSITELADSILDDSGIIVEVVNIS